MSRRRLIAMVCLALLLSLPFLSPRRAAAADATDQDVQHAIATLQTYLYSQQTHAGDWELSGLTSQKGGETALVTLALLASGQSPQNPDLAKAIKYLLATQMNSTYALSLRAQVLATLPDSYLHALAADTAHLAAMADEEGCFSYTLPPAGWDLSNTQYGGLAVWLAGQRGLPSGEAFWRSLTRHLILTQSPAGGWGYTADSPPYQSMTAAGINLLVAGQQRLDRRLEHPDPPTDKAIERGYQWLDAHYDGAHNDQWGAMEFYYLYSLERVGLAFGVKQLHGQDWFASGAQHVIDRLQQKPSWIDKNLPETAFALAFLARGRVPVWVTKLRPGDETRDRPNDIYFLTNYLSDLRQAEVNWQFAKLDPGDADRWFDAPIAYIASDDALDLTDDQVQTIKRYLDGGGTLLANADLGSGSMIKSIRALAQRLYPQWPMKALPPDHPIYHALFPIVRPESEPIQAVSNGVRELILLPEHDWGRSWQMDDHPGQSDAWRLAANLLVMATNRGQLPPRLQHRRDDRIDRPATGTLGVALLRVAGRQPPEPDAWSAVAPTLFNRTGLSLTTVVTDLDDLPQVAAHVALVHLQGVDPADLTPAQRAILADYARAGGTILIETVGGLGGFARSAEDQLARTFNAPVLPLPADQPILTGQDLQAGSDMRHVVYRPYSVARLDVSPWPRLAAIDVAGRPAVIVSREDLSLGMLGVNRWAIHGYTPDSARGLAINLLLWAAQNSHKDTRNTNETPKSQ